MTGIRRLLRVEALVVALLAAALAWRVGPPWGLFAVALVAPDLSLLGRLLDDRRAAIVYDAAHTYVGPALVGCLWFATRSDGAATVALAWTLHIGIDRALGFGLKDPGDIGMTHLGRTGRIHPR
ncbi:MAG: DUF4260 family protein [Amaricoccus sp.]